MKTLLTFALLALIGLLHLNSAANQGPGSINESCCSNVTRLAVPKGRIQNVVRSHSKCPVPSIIVTTVCKKQICLVGSWNWAKKVLTEFEKSLDNKKSPSAPFNTLPC
ncbi:C-C motif chemokine 2-like [Sparus aurata]|uniref:C-C motif chemokine 2-like n=1 Tax=Sparus aurata TaxID=8175 RepID=A0A671X0Z8_SPAAU|nr:C-C motif chemokine 2-like [Sparus aurata]XP_030270870.1 C-C motif chemokine 2-like [Sparus aurata]